MNQGTITIWTKPNSKSINNSMSNYLGSSNWLTTSSLCRTHRLSSRLQPAPPHHYRCSLWSCHGTGIFKMLDLCCNWDSLSPIASPGHSSETPALSRDKPQLLSMTSSHLQNPYPMGDYQVWLPEWGTILATSGAQFTYANPEERLPWRFHLNDAGLLLNITYSLAPTD